MLTLNMSNIEDLHNNNPEVNQSLIDFNIKTELNEDYVGNRIFSSFSLAVELKIYSEIIVDESKITAEQEAFFTISQREGERANGKITSEMIHSALEKEGNLDAKLTFVDISLQSEEKALTDYMKEWLFCCYFFDCEQLAKELSAYFDRNEDFDDIESH